MSQSDSEDDIQDDKPKYQIQYEGESKVHPYVVKDGVATATFPNNEVYKGEYKNKKRHGKGEYTFKDGSKYVGDWVDGKRTGNGIIYHPDGSKYVGQFLNGKRHGHGTYFYSNGDKFCGQWHQDVKHGQGSYIVASSQTQITGNYVNGQCRNGVWEYFDGTPFFGVFSNSTVHTYHTDPEKAHIEREKVGQKLERSYRGQLSSLFDHLVDSNGTISQLSFVRLAKLLDPRVDADSLLKVLSEDHGANSKLTKAQSVGQLLQIVSLSHAHYHHIKQVMKFAKSKRGKDWINREGHIKGSDVFHSDSKDDVHDSDFPDDGNMDQYTASRLGATKAIKRLLAAKVNLQVPDNMGNSPLYYACHSGHSAIVKQLLDEAKVPWDSKCMHGALNSSVRALLKQHRDLKANEVQYRQNEEEE